VGASSSGLQADALRAAPVSIFRDGKDQRALLGLTLPQTEPGVGTKAKERALRVESMRPRLAFDNEAIESPTAPDHLVSMSERSTRRGEMGICRSALSLHDAELRQEPAAFKNSAATSTPGRSFTASS
jgi:hypothetical protein